MTREEGKEFANALKNNYTIDFDKMPDFCDLVISALSAEPCEDSISRELMLNAITEVDDHCNMDIYTNEVREIVNELPSVQPIRPKGEWIYQEGVIPYKWRCNKCERMFKTDFNFCPNCGADMRGDNVVSEKEERNRDVIIDILKDR